MGSWEEERYYSWVKKNSVLICYYFKFYATAMFRLIQYFI